MKQRQMQPPVCQEPPAKAGGVIDNESANITQRFLSTLGNPALLHRLKPMVSAQRFPTYDRIRKIVEWTPPSRRLLDLGCDRGSITVRYRSKAQEVVGVDTNPAAIRDARKKYPGVKFVLTQGKRLPFPDNHFDTVVMGDVLEHVADEKKTLAEIYRVLQPGGTLLLSVPHKGLFGFLDSFNLKFHFPRLYRWWKGKSYNPDVYTIQPWHRHYSLNELARFFNKRFRILRTHCGGLVLCPIIWVLEDMLTDVHCGSSAVWKPLAWLKHAEYQINFRSLGYSILVHAMCVKQDGQKNRR